MHIFTEGWRGQAILVTGDRNWANIARMETKLKQYPRKTLVIHGSARGADQLAHELCDKLRLVSIAVPYLGWAGKESGPTRNSAMLDILLCLGFSGYRIEVIAFHGNLKASKGTKDMVRKALKAKVKTTLIKGD